MAQSPNDPVDVLIVGAGLAGLVIARTLDRCGQSVMILEKSRGLGGRLATRRFNDHCWVDHGCPAWYVPEDASQIVEGEFDSASWLALTQELIEAELLQAWDAHHPCLPRAKVYAVPQGMSAIGKYLAQELRVERQQRVIQINTKETKTAVWQVTTLNSAGKTQAWYGKTLVLAIPAPQALALCQPLQSHGLAAEFIRHLAAVSYKPRITALLKFASGSIQGLEKITYFQDDDLEWGIGDASKRPTKQPATLVLHSTSEFASGHFEAQPLAAVGALLWERFKTLSNFSRVNHPQELQVHRWRFAEVAKPYPRPYLVAPMSPALICCGDWCGRTHWAWGLGRAWQSGTAVATRLISGPF